jgi:hemoglobin-like flavoprotein
VYNSATAARLLRNVPESGGLVLTEEHKLAIRRSWRLLAPLGETVSELFYRRLFELRPDLRSLFPPDMEAQKRKLLSMLVFTVKSLDWPIEEWEKEVDPENDLFLVVLALGRRHRNLYKVEDQHYGPVGEALVWTLEQGLGQVFEGTTKEAWIQVYRMLSTTMKIASAAQLVGSFGKPIEA